MGNITAQVCRDTVLAPVVTHFSNRRHGQTVFQHDNAGPHTAHSATEFLTTNNVDVIPAMAAGILQIEQIWDK